MFHLTLSPDVSKIFEGFCILKRNEEVKCLYSFPASYSFQKFYQFIFPCNCPKEKSEEYCIVISNANNDRSFLLCRYSDVYEAYLCVYSHNPWFEILSKLLINLCHAEFMPTKFNAIRVYLQRIEEVSDKCQVTLPACKANDNVPQHILKSSLKYPYIYDKYIQEYLTAINQSSGYNKQLWLEVFWSMLLERPIIFMSKRYQKLTSSLLAATFFIHPLSWLHKFISIIPQKTPQLLGMNCCMLGIHNCMEPILENAEFWNEALLVDLDRGESKMVGASDNHKETQSRFKIPKYIKNFFINHIQLVDESVSNKSPLKIKDLISNIPWNINEEETMYNEYKKGFHIYPLLFRTLISLIIGNYRQFISLQEKGVEFEKEKFIQSNPKLTEFIKIFVQSQCFDCFIDDKLKSFKNAIDMQDRFDSERQELSYKIKIPNSKKPQKSKEKRAAATTVSLSSSTSSVNSNSVPRDHPPINLSKKSGSFDGPISMVVTGKNVHSKKDHLHIVADSYGDNVVVKPVVVKSTPFNDCVSTKVTNDISRLKPNRPIFKPGEAPLGRVQNLIQQINHGKLEGNSSNMNRKTSAPQIKPSELPQGKKPVSKLTSLFESKPGV